MPETYWQPWLGDRCNVSPDGIGALTPYQLDACFDYVDSVPAVRL